MSIGFYTPHRPKLAACIVFLQRGWKWQFQFDCNWRGLLEKKKICFAILQRLQNAFMQLWKVFVPHLRLCSSWMYYEQALSLEDNRCPPPSPLKKVPSASAWFTPKCTRVALGRAFSGTDGPVTCPLISPCPSWTERNVSSRQSAYGGAGSCKSPIPRLSKRCFRFTYVQFSFSSGAGVCRRFWQAPVVVRWRRLCHMDCGIRLELKPRVRTCFTCTAGGVQWWRSAVCFPQVYK